MHTVQKNRHISIFKDKTIYYSHSYTENPVIHNHSGHTHNVCELLLVKSGNVRYTVKGKQYRIKPYDLILSRPGDVHSVSFDGNATYERYDMLFDEKTLPFDIYTRIPFDLDVMNVENHKLIRDNFEKIDMYCSKLSANEFKSILTGLATEIFTNIMLDASPSREYSQSSENPTVARAVEFIDKNILTLKSLDELCSALYVTKSHLHHLFIEHMKVSPKKYITAKRLDIAEKELFLGASPSEVCARCGYSDYSAFYRAYKSHFGHSPSVKSADVGKVVTIEDLINRTDE